MPTRQEYLNSNIKSQSLQKNVAGICSRSKTTLTPLTNWQDLNSIVSANQRMTVSKDSSGAVSVTGGMSVTGTISADASLLYPFTTLPPDYRPKGTQNIYVALTFFNTTTSAYQGGVGLVKPDGTVNLLALSAPPPVGTQVVCSFTFAQ